MIIFLFLKEQTNQGQRFHNNARAKLVFVGRLKF